MTQPHIPDYFNGTDEIPVVHGPDSDVYGVYRLPKGGSITVFHNPEEPSGLGYSLFLEGVSLPFVLDLPKGKIITSRLNQIPADWVKESA